MNRIERWLRDSDLPVDKSLANSDGQPPSRTEERRSLLDLFRN